MNLNTVFIPNLMTAKISETCLYINTNKQCYDNNIALEYCYVYNDVCLNV